MTPPTPARSTTNAVLCRNCQKRPGILEWTGDGGTLAYVHGLTVRWCELCAVEAQLAHARERAVDIPALEAKLAALLAEDRSDV